MSKQAIGTNPKLNWESLPMLLHQQVLATPDRVAIQGENATLTYDQLYYAAQNLAIELQQRDIQKEDLVMVAAHRSAEMIVAALAVMIAGAAYVPVDVGYPKDRLKYLVENSDSKLILTNKSLEHIWKDIDRGDLYFIDDLSVEPPSKTIQLSQIASFDLAYMIYTSGSTGKPKGVLIEHKSLVNCVTAHQEVLDYNFEKYLFAYSFAFDGAVMLTWMTLCSGGTLVMAPEGLEKDIYQFATFIKQNQINHLLTFPSLYGLVLHDRFAPFLKSVKTVSVAGEACPGQLVRRHYSYLPSTRFFNEYGPTEATVGTTVYEAHPDHDQVKTPIGKAVSGTEIILLNENQEIISDDSIGEIAIGGLGVARGYYKRPELTAQKFIAHPVNEQQNVYLTGDLARWLPDGNLDFIGRKDNQVKLRGFRIELGEVEANLKTVDGVKEAVVLLKGSEAKDQRLVAYIKYKNGAEFPVEDIKKEMLRLVPEYMVPSLYIGIENFPIAPSGKIDRKALPDPDYARPDLEANYEAPKSKLEKFLVELWEKSLGITPIGIHDKFFELGGNSLQAASFISELQSLLNETIFIVTIFEHPTIAQFAAMLARDYGRAVEKHFGKNLGTTISSGSSTSVLSSSEIKAFLSKVPERNPNFAQRDLNPPAIFILAPPRSGTSLLRVMLDGHPQIFAANELQLLHFENMQERAEAYSGKFSLWKEGLLRAIMELKRFNADEALELVQSWEQQKLSTATVFAKLQSWTQGKILLDKSPSYALDINALRSANQEFKNAKFIHLSRNPYAMIDSFDKMHLDQVMYLKENEFKGKQLGELIWHQSHANIEQFFTELNDDQKIHLSYESLVKNPKFAIKVICMCLDLPFDEACLKPYDNLEQKMTDGIHPDSKPMGDVNFFKHGKIQSSLADKWKKASQHIELAEETKLLATQLGHKIKEEDTNLKSPSTQEDSIAIIGMHVRLPGAANTFEFWENLKSGKDVSKDFTREQILAAGIDPELLDEKGYVKKGMTLDDYDKFDASFFGYLPKEAALMDPQHRIFLEVAAGAMDDASIDPKRYPGKIGIYGGIARNTYLVNNVMTHPNYFSSLDDFQIGIALEKDFPATRVAYKLNLNGPAVSMQTACSSSGVALHFACQSLKSGDADVILVGGGRIQPLIEGGYLHKDGHALSPTGYCHTFDDQAQGMVRGQGMVCLVLKKLSKAIEDGDTVRAIIRGSAINNDGSDKIGFTAPSVNGQAAAIKKAYENAGITADEISYIEAHGTGTALGDPIEISGLTKAFSAFTPKKQFCAIASVKTNIGHLDAGACLAGIVKTVLALENELLPANLNYSKPNSQIDFSNSPFFVNDKQRPWPRSNTPRIAGISSLGLGGTNVHVVIQEAPIPTRPAIDNSRKSVIIPISAKRKDALDIVKNDLQQHYINNPSVALKDMALTFQLGRGHYKFRKALVLPADVAPTEFDEKLFAVEKESSATPAKLVFMFPGGGSQYINMGKELYQEEPIFKKHIDECLEILKHQYELDLAKTLYPDNNLASEAIVDPLHGITLLFAVEYACAKLWMSWGIVPDVMLGHSLGEYTAACLAGVFSLEDALAMVHSRGVLFNALDEGGMLSIALPPEEVKILVGDRLDFAAINHPDHCVVSGSKKAIDEVKAELNELEIHATRPKINVAAHSREIEPILAEFKKTLDKINFQIPKFKLIANVRGDWAKDQDMQSAQYWLDHLRSTVLFGEGLKQVFTKYESATLLEVGPGQTLSTFARQNKNKPLKTNIIASIRHPKEGISDSQFMSQSVAKLWALGHEINWNVYQEERGAKRIALPTYPFAKEKHWIAPKVIQKSPSDYSILQTMKVNDDDTSAIDSSGGGSRQELLKEKLKLLFHQMSGISVQSMDSSTTFLEMGFDSLFLTQAVAKIKKQFNVKLSFRQLFDEYSNLVKLSDFIDQNIPADQYSDELEKNNQNFQHSASIEQTVPNTAQEFNKLQNLMAEVSGDDLQKIIQQQLIIMQQQLALLSGQRITPTKKSAPKNNSKSDLPGKLEASKDIQTNKLSTQDSNIEKNILDAGAFRLLNKTSGQTKKRILQNWSDLSERETKYLKEFILRYNEHTKGSQALTQAQRKHLADPRSISGFNPIWKDLIYQLATKKSSGAKIWDVDGNEYIDYGSAFGISLFGHSPKFVKDAVAKQLAEGFELGVLSPLAKDVADLLCELSGMERITIVNTGSEALSASVRAARTVTGRERIAVFEGDYHGIADELLVRSLNPDDPSSTMPVAPGIPSSLVDQVLVLHYDDPDVLQKIEAHADDLAAILIEPIQPVNPAFQPRALLQAIRKLTAEKDIALIFDEMITGFRLGVRGAQDWYGIDADIVAYGKIISGGLPFAAVAGSAKYLDAFDGGQWSFGDDSVPPAGVTFFGGTFVRHPLGLAAAKAALLEIKSRGADLYEDLNQRSKKFAHQIMELFNKTKAPFAVHGTSSIIVFKAIDNNPFIPLFYKYCILKGLHLTPKAALITTAHSDEDFEKTLQIIEEVIREMQTAGFFPIHLREYEPQHRWIDVPQHQEPELLSDFKSRDEQLPLTEGQKEVWVEHQLGAEAAAAYNLAGRMEFNGTIDEAILTKSIEFIINRHEALQVVFDKNEPAQKLIQADLPFRIVDLSGQEESDVDHEIQKIFNNCTEQPFDLFNGPLIDFMLIKKSKQQSILVMNAHHGVADGWSCGIIAKEVASVYSQLCKGQSPHLPKAKSYVEFVKQQNEFVKSKEHQEHLDYWKKIFEDDIPGLELPTDRKRPAIKTYDANFEAIVIPKEKISKLKSIASQNGATLFAMLYSSFRVLLSRLSGQEDFVLGLVAAAHTIGGNENLVTHGASLLPVRNTIDHDHTFIEELQSCRNLIYDAFDHQRFTIGTLVRALNIKRDPSRQPIISHLFNMDAEGEELFFGALKTSTQPIRRNYETFDSFFNVKAVGSEIHFDWIYNIDLFDAQTIQNFLAQYLSLLDDIISAPEKKIVDLDILSKDDLEKLKTWQGPKFDVDRKLTLSDLIIKQATKTPSKIAISGSGRRYTYTELNEHSNRIAHRLIQANIGVGDRVGVYLERSPELIIALLAILKTGAMYVPIDPIYPMKRCHLLLEQANINLLISEQSLKKNGLEGQWKKLWMNGDEADWKNAPSHPPKIKFSGKEKAYIIYTSGSSGTPKSVSIPHSAVIDHHQGMIAAIGITPRDKMLSVASVSFDPSVQDYFLPLMIGASVCIATREEQLDGRLLAEKMEAENITLMQATPATWKLLINSKWNGKQDLTILSGGEGLNHTIADTLLQKCHRLFNIYGPTETTIWSTAYQVPRGDRPLTTSGYEPVGKPLQNVEIYMLDSNLKQLPPGIAGELYIGGPTLAPDGYHLNEDLTKKHFVQSPFDPNAKLYRTGDIAKFLSTGDIEFLGRRDGQVKIRGYRIELGEIEANLSGYSKIKNNVVVPRQHPNGESALVAYVVMSNGTPLDTAEAKSYLSEKLPAYMVPNHWVQLSAFPLTSTLKVDRKKLPEPEWIQVQDRDKDLMPETESEKLVAMLWSEMLGITNINVNDNFFDLGGHSLIAVKLIAEIETVTGNKLRLSSIMEHPDLKGFASLLDGKKEIQQTGSLVPIRTKGNKKAVYLIHGAGLHVLMYQTLADHMDQDQPIYGFQARGIYGEAKPFDRIEDIAHHYIEEIMLRDPEGPYALAGYSFGGLITFEMAKQLQARGKEVAMLGMFDTVVRPEITGQNWSYYRSLNRMGRKVAWNLKAMAQSPIENFRYKSSSLSRRFKRLSWNLRHDTEKELQKENTDFLALVDKMNKIAFENYKLTPYDGDIHLFRARERRFWMEDFDHLGWGPFAKGGIIVHEVPGDHLNLFNLPNGKEFARILQDTLHEVFSEKTMRK